MDEKETLKRIKKLIFEHSIESDGITLDDDQPPALDKILKDIFSRYDKHINNLIKRLKDTEEENRINEVKIERLEEKIEDIKLDNISLDVLLEYKATTAEKTSAISKTDLISQILKRCENLIGILTQKIKEQENKINNLEDYTKWLLKIENKNTF